MSLKQRALRGAAWAVAGGNVSQILSFVMFIAISRVVGPEAFGAVAIAIALIEVCRPIASEAIVGNLVASGRLDAKLFNAGFFLSVGVSLLLCAVLALSAPLFAQLFRTPALETVLPSISLLLVLYAASRVQEAHLLVELRFASLAVRSVVAAMVGGLVGIAAAYAGWGIQALVLQQWATATISLALVWVACSWRPSLNLSGEDTRQLLRSSAALAPAGLVAQLTLLTDALAVASFSGPHAAGLYNLGKRARLALQLGLSSALDRVSLPTFARVRADKELLSRTLETALRLSTIVVFPVFVGAGAIAPELVAMFLGPDWAGAALSMTLLLVAGAIAMTTHYFDNILLILERRRWIVTLRLAMLFALVLLLATFGRLGPAHVASAALVSTALHNFTAFWVVSREARVPVRVYLETVLLPLAISISMLALLTLLRDIASVAALGPIVRMALFIVLGAAVYIGFAWFLARRSVQQLISAARNVLTTRPSTSEAT